MVCPFLDQMVVTAEHAGIGKHEGEDPPRRRSSNFRMVCMLRYALELITHAPHTGHLQTNKIIRLRKWERIDLRQKRESYAA